jgi:hypothetical protein
MTGQPPPPAADDEVERRLAALKAGADPGTFGPSPRPPERAADGPAPPSRPPGGAGQREGAAAGREDAGDPPVLTGEVIEDGRTWGPASGARRPDMPPPGPGIRAVSWGISQAEAGRLGLWIGLALVVFGGYLVLAELVPGISVLGSLALAVVGVVLVAWHLAGRAGAWAVHAGVVVGGFGIARLVAEIAGLPSSGWGTLGAGLGLLVIGIVRVSRGEGVRWQAWLGAALALFGGWGVLGATIPGFPTLGDLIVPLVLVLIGVAVLRRGFRTG